MVADHSQGVPLATVQKLVFREEIYAAPKNWVEKAFPNLIFFNKHDNGGHFAAWDNPKL